MMALCSAAAHASLCLDSTGGPNITATEHAAVMSFAGFGSLKSLVKLQASYNPFETLPDDMWQLPALELFRLAVGHLKKWPADLGAQPKHQHHQPDMCHCQPLLCCIWQVNFALLLLWSLSLDSRHVRFRGKTAF